MRAFDSGGSTNDDAAAAAAAKKRYDNNIFRKTFGTSKDWFGGSSGAAPPTASSGPSVRPGGVVSGSSADDAMGPPVPAPAGWQGLGDQSREAAFNPNFDYADPGNKHVTDFQGRVNPQAYQQAMAGREGQGQTAYSPPPQPVTKLTSAKDLNDQINKLIGLPPEPPPAPTNADFNGSGQWPRVPLQAQGGGQPPAGPMPEDPFGRREPMGPPRPSPSVPQVAATPPPAQPPGPRAQTQNTGPTSPFSGGDRNNASDPTSWLSRMRQRVGFDMGGGVPGMDEEGIPASMQDDFMIGLPKLGASGPSHAVIGQSAMPQAPAPPQGGKDKGGGGGGDIMGSIMKMAPMALMMLARGGRTGFMRGGYPESFNQPPMPIPGLPQRTAFSGRGYVQGDGQGDGRSDHIDASLSPGEYVMDAETTSLLGDGDNEAGARKLDQFRKNVRAHKGAQLAKGQFSPKAKPAESYLSAKPSAADRLAHSGVGDGMRRGRR